MAQSGHIIAHIAQPMHASSSVQYAVNTPSLLRFSCWIATICLGHAVVHSSQPLQRSKMTFIFAIGVTIPFRLTAQSAVPISKARREYGAALPAAERHSGVPCRIRQQRTPKPASYIIAHIDKKSKRGAFFYLLLSAGCKTAALRINRNAAVCRMQLITASCKRRSSS